MENKQRRGTVQWTAALSLVVCIVQKRGQEFQRELLFVMVMTPLDMARWLHPEKHIYFTDDSEVNVSSFSAYKHCLYSLMTS